jgi:mRNA interferase MazF
MFHQHESYEAYGRAYAKGAPSEVVVGHAEGLKAASAINLDHVQTVERAALSHYVGQLAPARSIEVCRALAIATGCDG